VSFSSYSSSRDDDFLLHSDARWEKALKVTHHMTPKKEKEKTFSVTSTSLFPSIDPAQQRNKK
jgi:hypothetical protein